MCSKLRKPLILLATTSVLAVTLAAAPVQISAYDLSFEAKIAHADGGGGGGGGGSDGAGSDGDGSDGDGSDSDGSDSDGSDSDGSDAEG